MLWKKSWEPEAMFALIGGIIAALFFGNLAAAMLQKAQVPGFKGEDSAGGVLLATLSFQGAALAAGTVFLWFYDLRWRDVLGELNWKQCLWLAIKTLAALVPVIFLLKFGSAWVLEKMGQPVDDQRAVDLFLNTKSPWLMAYLVVFAVVLAPLGEEFFFRGLLFSIAKRYGCRKLGYIGGSLLFALVHYNAPTFLPLFALAIGLTWLYEKTEGLRAPIMAHSLFNLANLVWLLVCEKYFPDA